MSNFLLGGTKEGLQASGRGKEFKAAPITCAPFEIPFETKPIICERYGTSKPPALVFTHGAGGGITNPATKSFAQGYSRAGSSSSVVCFQGVMNLQSRVKSFHAVIEHEKAEEAVLGGRSMGARAAVIAAKGHKTKALVLVSYPLVGQNGEIRDQILLDVDEGMDLLFVSGDKDEMCEMAMLEKVRARMKTRTWLAVVKGADHGMSLKPKDAVDKMREYTGTLAARWVEKRDENKTECVLRWDGHRRDVVDDGWKVATTTTAAATAGSQKDIKRMEEKEADTADDDQTKPPAPKRRKKV